MQPAEQTANKIRWWSHVKRVAQTAPQSKARVIHPVGKRPRGRPRNRWEDDVPKWYKEMGIPMTGVNNWAIVYQLDTDGRRVCLKYRKNVTHYPAASDAIRGLTIAFFQES